MYRALFLLVAAALGTLAAFQLGYIGAGGGVRLEGAPGAGQTVIAELDGFSGTYRVSGPAARTYLMFGGGVGVTSFAHINFLGAEEQAMRPLLAKFPDFHKCDSASAPEFIRIAEDINIVGSEKVVGKMYRAMREARSREASRGERLCAKLQGQWLDLVEVRRSDGEVHTAEDYFANVPRRPVHYFMLLESLQTGDCKDSLKG